MHSSQTGLTVNILLVLWLWLLWDSCPLGPLSHHVLQETLPWHISLWKVTSVRLRSSEYGNVSYFPVEIIMSPISSVPRNTSCSSVRRSPSASAYLPCRPCLQHHCPPDSFSWVTPLDVPLPSLESSGHLSLILSSIQQILINVDIYNYKFTSEQCFSYISHVCYIPFSFINLSVDPLVI